MRYFTYILLVLLGLLTSCSKYIYQTTNSVPPDGKYDSEFPFGNSSEQLENISRSIKKVSSIVFYDLYEFNYNQEVTLKDINPVFLRKNAIVKDIISDNKIGSATVIYKDINHIALLTCAHIVDLQDTIITKFQVENKTTDFIKSIAIKNNQRQYIHELIPGKEVEILAIDKKKDIALIGLEASEMIFNNINVFPYPIGKSDELEWGNFVYIMGYPMGYKMITRGIVSNSRRSTNGNFLIDAVFNHGFSGGVVLALRDGVPNFELVGMVSSTSAKYENFLVPELLDGRMTYAKNTPYKGNFYVERRETINYGVTFSIPMETILDFYKKNEELLLNKGYDLNHFFEN